MITIQELKLRTADRLVLKAVNHLLPQLSPTAKRLNLSGLRRIVKNRNTPLFVLRKNNEIVGMATLVLIYTPYVGLRGRIEDVVVDEQHRGKGLGRAIMKKLIKVARARKVRFIDLTSRADRQTAHKFYSSLGFQLRNTAVYRLLVDNKVRL